MLIYLTGFMGAGKTTTGKKLASLLGATFIDLDNEIEKETGLPIIEIFKSGEFKFREIESMVLRNLSVTKNAIISCGGGTPCFNENLTWMKSNGITVYIRMTVGGLFHRLSATKQTRPLIAGKTDVELMEYIMETLKEREYYYKQCHYVVKGESLDAKELLSQIQKGETQLK
ncbi:MAG: shikimate kinase [Bacteroidota bacterium]|nr:shikimate kinase [Bacteroidota bacterium]